MQMKKMKKKVTITLLVSLIMLLIAACGNKSDAGADSAQAAHNRIYEGFMTVYL